MIFFNTGTCSPHNASQVLLKQEGRSHRQVTRTINPSTMLSLPEGGTYIIEVRALSEGGEGAVSSQVRLVTSSGETLGAVASLTHTHALTRPLKSSRRVQAAALQCCALN